MNTVVRVLLGIWGTVAAILWIGVCGAIYLVGAIFDRTGAWTDFCQLAFCRGSLVLVGVRVRVEGRENIPPEAACILMGNHRSYLDIPASVVALRPLAILFVAKKELTFIPFLGWALAASHHIKIDRGNREQAIGALRRAKEKMGRGIALTVFPEGTRSFDSRLLPFKKGGFHLAVSAEYPILPISIRNSGELLPKGSYLPRRGEVTVVVHPMIPVTGKERVDVPGLMEEVRGVILSGLPDARTRETPAEAGADPVKGAPAQ